MRLIRISLLSAILFAALQGGAPEAGAEEPVQPEAAFALFADLWMAELSEETARERARGFLFGTEAVGGAEAGKAKAVSYRAAAGDDFAIRTQATGKAAAPYVGILSYTEETWECADASRESCTLVDSSPVTEIFPYTDGSWRH